VEVKLRDAFPYSFPVARYKAHAGSSSSAI
jgi:hypothetical protein